MQFTGKLISQGLKAVGKKPEITGYRKNLRIWVMVIDPRIARFFKKEGRGLELIGESTPSDDVFEEAELTNAALGRESGTGGYGSAGRHKVEPRMGPERKKELYFIHEIAEWLEEAVQKDAFDNLVLVAAPDTLGDLRNILKKNVQDRVSMEIDKNLTKMGERELAEKLEILGA